MEETEARALVLSCRPYRETSLLLEVLCESQGRLTLVCRGAYPSAGKRATRATPAPLSVIAALYSAKAEATIATLQQWEVERSFPNLRLGLDRYAYACWLAEVAQVAVASRQTASGLFDTLVAGWQHLDSADSPTKGPRLPDLIMRLAEELGYGLQLDHCAQCGRGGDLPHFDPSTCVALCGDCAPAASPLLPLPPRLAQQLAHSTPNDCLACAFAVNAALEIHLERKIPSMALVLSLTQPA